MSVVVVKRVGGCTARPAASKQEHSVVTASLFIAIRQLGNARMHAVDMHGLWGCSSSGKLIMPITAAASMPSAGSVTIEWVSYLDRHKALLASTQTMVQSPL